MKKRIIQKPSKSFFLLGPRGTGKTTWLKTLPFNLTIDLLNSRSRLELLRDPSRLIEMVAHLKPNSWVLIDEVQKIPQLLNEVHFLYESKKINFALSGSSARKLKRSGSNLLAGRAINRSLFPFCYPEYKDFFSLSDAVNWGTLPLVVDNFSYKEDTLETYLDNYLKQELIEEGILRKLEPFVRFLQVAGIMNGQILNVENIARESRVARSTVDKYFNMLEETLIGFKLMAYRPGIKVKESASPKFYFFDSGVARVAAGMTREHLDREYLGYLFETFLLNEIRSYNHYSGLHRNIFHYNVSNSHEIDLIVQLTKKTVSRPEKVIAIEIKYSPKWNPKWSGKFQLFSLGHKKVQIDKAIGIYTGKQRLTINNTDIYPVELFLEELFKGNIF